MSENNNEELSGLKKAIALGYLPEEDEAPKVLATGKGEVARKIIDIAGNEGIQIYKDENLAKSLANLDVGETIPRELYQAVAEVLAFVYKLETEESSKDINS